MKIVMDFRKYDGVVGGVEQVIKQITNHITRHGHTVVLLPKLNRLEQVEKEFAGFPNLKIVPLNVDTHSMSLKNIYFDSVVIQDIAKEENADIIHFPYNWSFPFRKKVPCILTIHDVIPLTFREAMGWFRNNFLYKPGIKKACRLNNVITTISNFSKQDIIKNLGVSENKIKVIPNGLRKAYDPSEKIDKDLLNRFKLENGFILYAGGIHERKNVIRLMEAFKIFADKSNFKGKLLITGSISGAPYQIKMKKLCDAAVDKNGLQDKVTFTGFITDEELDSLMRNTLFFVYPSLYEGFGLPVLEAMTMGTPVITSNITALPEVAGDSALTIDPYVVDELVEAMVKLYNDSNLRKKLSDAGKRKTDIYSWEKTGKQFLDLYRSLSS